MPLVENVDGSSSTGRERTVAQCQVLEYRLADSTLPSGGLQEAVLLSAERFLSESRLSGSRTLDVVGFSEVREEPEVAQMRADAVHAWFLQQGVPASLLRVETQPNSERGARRVELRLYDADKTKHQAEGRSTMNRLIPEAEVRGRAEHVLGLHATAGAYPTEQPAIVESASTQTNVPGPAIDAAATVVTANQPPTVSVEEVTSDGVSRRQLQVVFAKQGLSAKEVAVEVGERTVRLASLVGAWQDMEVPLPFAVVEAESDAKFSKKAGTLTLKLRAAE